MPEVKPSVIDYETLIFRTEARFLFEVQDVSQGVGHGVRAYDEAEFFALIMAPTYFKSELILPKATSDTLLP